MPILTVVSDAADAYIVGENAVYATARGTATGHGAAGTMRAGQWFIPPYYCYRSMLVFDTSAIGAGAIVNQVNMILTCTTNATPTDFDVQIVKQDWSAQNPIDAANRDAAYDGCLAGAADDNIWRNTAGIAVNTPYTSPNLDTAWVNVAGLTYYSLRSDRDFTGVAPAGQEYIFLASSDHATPAYRPQLVIDYTLPAAGLLLQMQNHGVLNGGML